MGSVCSWFNGVRRIVLYSDADMIANPIGVMSRLPGLTTRRAFFYGFSISDFKAAYSATSFDT